MKRKWEWLALGGVLAATGLCVALLFRDNAPLERSRPKPRTPRPQTRVALKPREPATARAAVHRPLEATISGKVTLVRRSRFHSRPLTSGQVVFHVEGQTWRSEISPHGTYQVSGVRSGLARITVSGNRVPPTVAVPETSPLTYEVDPGRQYHDIVIAE